MKIHDTPDTRAKGDYSGQPTVVLLRTLAEVKLGVRTLVGVLGHGACMFFLLGKCPRLRVTFDGAPERLEYPGTSLLISPPLV